MKMEGVKHSGASLTSPEEGLFVSNDRLQLSEKATLVVMKLRTARQAGEALGRSGCLGSWGRHGPPRVPLANPEECGLRR